MIYLWSSPHSHGNKENWSFINVCPIYRPNLITKMIVWCDKIIINTNNYFWTNHPTPPVRRRLIKHHFVEWIDWTILMNYSKLDIFAKRNKVMINILDILLSPPPSSPTTLQQKRKLIMHHFFQLDWTIGWGESLPWRRRKLIMQLDDRVEWLLAKCICRMR